MQAATLRCDDDRAEKPGVGTSRPSSLVSCPADEFRVYLARAREGSPAYCQWLYESLAGRVAGYLRLRGADEPDDLTSEVFLRVFDHLRDFDGDESGFRSWVFTIAHRLLIDEHRHASRRLQSVELSVHVTAMAAGGDVETDALRSLGDQETVRLLAGLKPDQREVLTLRIVGDLTVEQVAEVLGKSRGAVKSLQHRGVGALRRRLAETTS